MSLAAGTNGRTPGQHMLDWKISKDEICRRVRGNPGVLKIVLKTKDESDFLEWWVEHHSKIVGLESLIVFDNESTDRAVLNYYDSFMDQSVVVRFAGFHNLLHSVGHFPELYEALQDSCEYFTFLDSDEFLTWVREDGTFTQNTDLVSELSQVAQQDAIAGIWLDNVAGYDDRFILYSENGRWPRGLTGGKPIISSKANIDGFINHNFQLNRFANTQNANSLILHMKRLLPRQRIRVNISKLRKYKFLADDEGIDKITNADANALPAGNVRQWVKEIQELLDQGATGPDEQKSIEKGHIRLGKNSSVDFHSESEREQFLSFLRDPGPVINRVIRNKVKRYRTLGGTLGHPGRDRRAGP